MSRIGSKPKRSKKLKPVLTLERIRSAYLASDDVLVRYLLEDAAFLRPVEAASRRGEAGKSASDETGVVVQERLGLDTLNRTMKHQLNVRAQGTDVPSMVMALLPGSLSSSTREDLSRALAYVARNRTFVHNSWPVVYSGLSNLGSAVVHIYRVARFMGQKVEWLLAIWEREVTRVEMKAARDVLAFVTKDVTYDELRSAIDKSLIEVRGLLPRSTFASWLERVTEPGVEVSGRPLTKNESPPIGEESPRIKEELRQAILDRPEKETIWRAVSPSADGAAAYKYHDLIRSFDRSLVAPSDGRVLRLCQKLARREPSIALSSEYIARTIHVKRHEADALGQIITEAYSPNLQRLALQLRIIMTKNARSGLQTNGLCERLSIDDPRYSLALGFVEPSGSPGPSRSGPDNAMHIVADTKTVAMCLDMPLNEQEYTSSRSRLKKHRLILSIGGSSTKKTIRPSAREVDMMCLMWGFDGTQRQREELFDRSQLPKSTRAYTREQILKESMMSRMYHPRLEYSGIPDGLLIAARRMKTRDRDRFRTWLLNVASYVELLEDHPVSGTCDVVATVRVPRGEISVLGTMVQGKLADLDLDPVDYVACRIRHQSTYRLSALNRIFDSRTCKWTDPWSK